MTFDWSAEPDLIESLPISGDSLVMCDPLTGLSIRVPLPIRFLVTDDDTYCVTNLRTGERWRIGLDMDGEYWKEPLPRL